MLVCCCQLASSSLACLTWKLGCCVYKHKTSREYRSQNINHARCLTALPCPVTTTTTTNSPLDQPLGQLLAPFSLLVEATRRLRLVASSNRCIVLSFEGEWPTASRRAPIGARLVCANIYINLLPLAGQGGFLTVRCLACLLRVDWLATRSSEVSSCLNFSRPEVRAWPMLDHASPVFVCWLFAGC